MGSTWSPWPGERLNSSSGGMRSQNNRVCIWQSRREHTAQSAPKKTSSTLARRQCAPAAFHGRNKHYAETSAPQCMSSAFPARLCSHLRSSSCRRRLCFSFCMFLETLNTSLGEGNFKRGNKLRGKEIRRSLSQEHSWYSQR